ncbi:MAG: hypothetical protein ACI9FR_000302, partial [Cryomorphaceae bacterium]
PSNKPNSDRADYVASGFYAKVLWEIGNKFNENIADKFHVCLSSW